ncbi:unnamed protein product [Closterium sp. NIES-65]|nr:unnamed protein product [Closterium sp. NIES-65]
MASSPDSSSTVVRRQRPCNTPSAAAARARTSPRPFLPQPSPPVSSSSDASRPPLPRVPVPAFPERKRPQGQLKRNADAQPPSPRHRMTKKVRKAITVKEKLHWLKLQDSQPDLGNRALAKLAKVQPCQIREWRKMKERLDVASGCRRRLMGFGRKAKYPFMERAVYRHFLNHCAKGLAVSVRMLQQWSSKYMTHRMPSVNWRASFRWATRFRSRWHLARRVKTKMGQKLAAGVVVRAQEKGWMDESLVQDWITQLVDDELVVNPFYAEAPVPAEEVQPAEEDVAAEEEEAAEAAAAAEEEEWNTPEEGEEAGVFNDEDDEWWRAGRYDGEECEEWVAEDDEDTR